MNSIQTLVEAFFSAYESRLNEGLADPLKVDVEATKNSFAACFIEANPKGVQCSKNDGAFRQAIAQGLDYYRKIGTRWMKRRSIEVMVIDDLHALAKVQWQAHYLRKDGRQVTLDFAVSYILQLTNSSPKIFAYVTGDEQKAYEEHGLTP